MQKQPKMSNKGLQNCQKDAEKSCGEMHGTQNSCDEMMANIKGNCWNDT